MSPQNDVARKMVETIRVRVPQSQSPYASSSSQLLSDCCSSRFMIQNHSNFKRSGAPARFMFYRNGSWINFPNEVLGDLRLGFLEGKPIMDLSIGGSNYLFDFLRMLQIDFLTENQRSIAWIDENGKCFFPKVFVDEEFANSEENPENPKIEIEIRIDIDGNSSKRKRDEFESNSNSNSNEDEAEVTSSKKPDEDDTSKRLRLTPTNLESSRFPNARLLSQADKAYPVVSNYFTVGIKKIDQGATITAIHQCTRTGPLERARYQVFEKQIETIKAARGESNTVYAWHCASARDVEGILKHGFAVPSNGVGIYLSPVGLPHISTLQSKADDNGEKHVILCRVILGKVEKVNAGSQQCHPSSGEFDTGADDLKNPKWYVVWCTNMNSHILPECVVSFKSSGHSFGPGKYPFSKLFSKMNSSLSALKVQETRTLYEAFKAGKVTKDVFIKQLRSVVGDEMLRSTIQEIHASE